MSLDARNIRDGSLVRLQGSPDEWIAFKGFLIRFGNDYKNAESVKSEITSVQVDGETLWDKASGANKQIQEGKGGFSSGGSYDSLKPQYHYSEIVHPGEYSMLKASKVTPELCKEIVEAYRDDISHKQTLSALKSDIADIGRVGGIFSSMLDAGDPERFTAFLDSLGATASIREIVTAEDGNPKTNDGIDLHFVKQELTDLQQIVLGR